MRIGIDLQSLQQKNTGLGIYTENLLKALKRLAPENQYLGYERKVSTNPNTLDRLLWENVILPRQAKKSRPDLLHVPGFAAPLRKPCPIVLTVPDLIGMVYSNHLDWPSRFYWSHWVPSSVNRADAIIAISESTRKDLERLKRIPPKQVTVTPLAARPYFTTSPNGLDQGNEEVLNTLGIQSPFILSVGTLEPRKNLVRLVSAFSSFLKEFPNYFLILAGNKAWDYDNIQRKISELGLHKKVFCPGYVEESALRALYRTCEFFVFPSLYEGFGLPLIEAMACGTACLTAWSSSLPEVGGSAVVYCDPLSEESISKEMRALAGDVRQREELGNRARAQAAQFSWEKTARATLRVYENL